MKNNTDRTDGGIGYTKPGGHGVSQITGGNRTNTKAKSVMDPFLVILVFIRLIRVKSCLEL
jgi:hypothetical protein